MRITNNIIRENALTNMRRGLQQMEAAQQQVGTGKKVLRASDDPGASATILRTRGSLRALEQYRSAIETANLRAGMEESALDELSELLDRAKELGVSQGTATADATTREHTRAEVEGLLRHAVLLANTEFDGNYLFGGSTSDVRPYDLDETGPSLDFTSSNPGGDHQVEISARQLVRTNHNGAEIFGTAASGPIAAVRDLARALQTNDVDAIYDALDSIDVAADSVQTLVADTGARLNHLQITSGNLDALEANLVTFKSDLEEVDMEKAITELVGRQSAFQAAMIATSRVMSLNLADYLR
jgi:flagellar hook-associated protein 3 FlgL